MFLVTEVHGILSASEDILHPSFAEGDMEAQRGKGCVQSGTGCPSQDENQLGSWSLLLWIVVISEFIRDQFKRLTTQLV